MKSAMGQYSKVLSTIGEQSVPSDGGILESPDMIEHCHSVVVSHTVMDKRTDIICL